jgi:predicted SprT family Zn-dependent metalloprotease
MKHIIIINHREARTPYEKKLMGRTETKDDTTHIFLNTKQNTRDLINTVYHELTHAIHYIFHAKLTKKEDERLARLIGDITEPCYREYRRSGRVK